MAILFIFRLFTRNLLRGSRRNVCLYILFCCRCLTWGLDPGLRSNMSTYYLLNNDGYKVMHKILNSLQLFSFYIVCLNDLGDLLYLPSNSSLVTLNRFNTADFFPLIVINFCLSYDNENRVLSHISSQSSLMSFSSS